MAISNDWTNKSLKIKQIDREREAYQAGMQNVLMMITGGRRERPAENPPPGGNPGKPPWPGYPNPMPPGKDWFAKEPVLPNFKPMGRVIKGVRDGVLPMKDTKIKQNLQIGPQANMKDSLQRENVGGTLRDMMLPLLIKEYGKDGSGRYKNPGALLSGMKKLAQLPANNIKRLGDTGHQTVLDDNRPGNLKIIKQFKPPKAQCVRGDLNFHPRRG